MVCTDAHIYLSRGIRSHRAGRNWLPSSPTTLVNSGWLACKTIGYDLAPRKIAVTFHHSVSIAATQGFFGKQRSVNTAVYHPRAASARHPADLIPTQSITCMYADADYISRHDAFRHNLLQRLIDKDGISRRFGVAAARTNSHLGVMTAVPNELSLGFTR